MKTSADPRHLKRVAAVKDLFAVSFNQQKLNSELARSVILHQVKIDTLITQSAPEWPLAKVAKVDLAILRLAVYELIVLGKMPAKVIIDEAVEIAKEYGSDTSSSFVNGVLGSILKKLTTNEN